MYVLDQMKIEQNFTFRELNFDLRSCRWIHDKVCDTLLCKCSSFKISISLNVSVREKGKNAMFDVSNQKQFVVHNKYMPNMQMYSHT